MARVLEKSAGPELTSHALKEKGNACVRDYNFSEAILHYSAAIKLNRFDHILYSNRSFALLQVKNYFFADQDAETVIQLNPSWAKGHFRKAEVLSAVGHYDLALLHYGRAIQLQPCDQMLLFAAQKVAKNSKQQGEYEKRLPWLGAGFGIIFGVIIALCDHIIIDNASLTHPTLVVLLIIVIACIGYCIARFARFYLRVQRKKLLEPPNVQLTDLKILVDDSCERSNFVEHSANRIRFSKSQGRMRFRKGKS